MYTTLEKAVGDLWGITSSEVGYNYELTLDITQLRKLPNLKIVYLGNGRDSLVTWFLMLVAYRRYNKPVDQGIVHLNLIELGSTLNTDLNTSDKSFEIDKKICKLGLLEYLDDVDIIVLPRVDSSFLKGQLDLEDLYKIFTVTLEGDNPLGYQVFLKSQRVFDCIIETKCLDIEMTPALLDLRADLERAKKIIRDFILGIKTDNLTTVLETTKLEFNELTIDEFIGGNYEY